MHSQPPSLVWLEADQDFPPLAQAWGAGSPAPGLLAAGARLDVDTLCRAYRRGIFPWFSAGQPILWWCPDPRMVLDVDDFRLHASLRKSVRKFRRTDGCEIHMDRAFDQVIAHCSAGARGERADGWIVPGMIEAYTGLHRAGLAHSVETWMDGELVGGLYCVAMGKFVFGESMFSRVSDASKIALAALVGFCRAHDIGLIDCQQRTHHLASLGAREISRASFIRQVQARVEASAPIWRFDPLYWNEIQPSQSLQVDASC